SFSTSLFLIVYCTLSIMLALQNKGSTSLTLDNDDIQIWINCETQTDKQRDKARTMVVFSVKAEEGGAYGPFNSDRTMMYNTVITNIGDAYDKCTGVFTAPTAGVYYFTFFYHNEEQVVMTSDHKSCSDNADNGGNAVFLKLEKGDEVCVHLPAGAHVWASGGHTTFSGFLVNSC
uniref:Complement C1q tumor necrosis factor-related protein 3-like n=1 Tax=Seriola lalandi dorsalis TaxID=1841481 RepID=A0A3B4X1B9_SERLL